MECYNITITDMEMMEISDLIYSECKQIMERIESKIKRTEEKTGINRQEVGAGANFGVCHSQATFQVEKEWIASKLKEQGYDGDLKFDKVIKNYDPSSRKTRLKFIKN